VLNAIGRAIKMKYGEVVKGECKFCGCVNFTFMEEREGYILGRCQCCGWIQLVKRC